MSRASEARMIRQRVMQSLQESQQKIAAQKVSQQVRRARQLHEEQLAMRGQNPSAYYGEYYQQHGTAMNPEDAATAAAYYQQEKSQNGVYVNTGGQYPPPPPAPSLPPTPNPPKERKNLVETKHNSQYNLNTLLAQNILRSDYFRSLYEKRTFQQVVDEIYYHVDHVEPWMNPATRKPSTAFCLLYKLFTMKLTSKQMKALLEHGDSPYIRALGFLYLRYVSPPAKIWSWFEPYIHDNERFSPKQRGKQQVTIGKWIQNCLLASDLKYYGTLLPRIPKQIETATQVNLLKSQANDNSFASTSDGDYSIGTIVRARYSEDGKWYDARIEEPGKKNGTYWVTYLPEDEYGNQEEVDLKNIKPLRQSNSGRKRIRETDEELRQRVLERERNNVATSGRNYAKPVLGVKNALAAPTSKRLRGNDETSQMTSKSLEEVLEKQGRLGNIEGTKTSSSGSKTSKVREGLLSRYGNVASSSADVKKEHKG